MQLIRSVFVVNNRTICLFIVRPSCFYFSFHQFFPQQVRVGGRNKNKNKIHSDRFPTELISKETRFSVFPSILIQLENGPNEFYFYFTN